MKVTEPGCAILKEVILRPPYYGAKDHNTNPDRLGKSPGFFIGILPEIDFSNNPNRIRVLVQVHQRDLYKQKWLKMLAWVHTMDLYEHSER